MRRDGLPGILAVRLNGQRGWARRGKKDPRRVRQILNSGSLWLRGLTVAIPEDEISTPEGENRTRKGGGGLILPLASRFSEGGGAAAVLRKPKGLRVLLTASDDWIRREQQESAALELGL